MAWYVFFMYPPLFPSASLSPSVFRYLYYFARRYVANAWVVQIWQIADKENRGLLTPSGFGVVMRLIGHAQAGNPPTDELALQRE